MAHENAVIDRVFDVLDRLPAKEQAREQLRLWEIRGNGEVSAEKRRQQREEWVLRLLKYGEALDT